MDGFKNIEIKNFRGIDYLKVEDFSRVNVFLGQNNSGKSTVLEAIHMLAGMSNPEMPQNLNRIRTKNFYATFADVFYLFHDMDVKNTPEFIAEQFDGNERKLWLNMTYSFDEKEILSQTNQMNGGLPVSETKTYLNTLEMNFETKEQGVVKRRQSSITVKPDGMLSDKKIAEGYLEKCQTVYLTTEMWGINLPAALSALFKRKQKDVVLKRLNLFDNRVTDIDILQDDVYVDFDNMPEKLPLRMVGDGMRRYLNMVAASANPMNNVILIDEIDNGLHYSAYAKIWKAIFELAVAYNKQIFVTTHSKETLAYLHEMLEENTDYQQELRLYTIENTLKKGLQAYKLTYEGLKGACTGDIEIRSAVR